MLVGDSPEHLRYNLQLQKREAADKHMLEERSCGKTFFPSVETQVNHHDGTQLSSSLGAASAGKRPQGESAISSLESLEGKQVL